MDDIDLTIRSIINDFWQTVLPSIRPSLVARDLSLGQPLRPQVGNLVKTVTGVRRCGKTFRLYQEVIALLENGVSPECICYFNFDDDRVRPYPDGLVSRVLELFFEMHPSARSQGSYLFFDEVQDVPGWEQTARRIVDTEKVTMYLTGSSSKLLSEDIATQFRGRSIQYELAPYSFAEQVRVTTGLDLRAEGEAALDNKENASLLRNAFARYLVCGGFPAVQELENMERVQTLQSYVQITVSRDVVERRGYSNAAYVRDLARYVVASSGRDLSISRIDHRGRSQGYSPGRERIADIIDAFEDAHLAYGVYDFTRSSVRSRLRGYKAYAVDVGLLSAVSPASTDGMTRALETAVYLELRRHRVAGRAGEVSMLKLPSGKEIDFVWGDEAFDLAYSLIQVCLSMDDEATRARELAALDEGLALFPGANAVVVTLSEQGIEHLAHGDVTVMSAWRWMLGTVTNASS